MIRVTIDPKSGFCFGVVRAIEMAEKYLKKGEDISSIGEMVHNAEEVHRLEDMGMKTISCADLDHEQSANVLIRAHGEPPSTYQTIKDKELNLVDATCPIVLKLQEKVRKFYLNHPESQIVIYGKEGHAEVIGLVGQTEGTAFVMSDSEDIVKLNPEKPVVMFSQTTMPLEGFYELKHELEAYINNEVTVFDTICRKVSHRVPEIHEFAGEQDVCIFVSGKNSSNGRMLYNVAKKSNPNTYFVSNADEINPDWFKDEMQVGICGATSTPQWLMEEVKKRIEGLVDLSD
jgi:4-hydroxy-3-methylbut-2-enyl diphosphate reductase